MIVSMAVLELSAQDSIIRHTHQRSLRVLANALWYLQWPADPSPSFSIAAAPLLTSLPLQEKEPALLGKTGVLVASSIKMRSCAIGLQLHRKACAQLRPDVACS